MFIQVTKSGYTRRETQYTQGKFLIIICDPNSSDLRPELRAYIRHTSFSPFGNFMMGTAKIGKIRLVLSGTYGNDGLPIHLPNKSVYPITKQVVVPHTITQEEINSVWEGALRIPKELQTAFWEGGGHNTGGKEMPSLKAWALKILAMTPQQLKRTQAVLRTHGIIAA